MKMNSKGITAVVAVSLLVIVSVLAVFLFQSWISQYESLMENKVEKNRVNEVDIKYASPDEIILETNSPLGINVKEVKVGNKVCYVNTTISGDNLTSINLGNCTAGVSAGVNEVVIVTDDKIISKYFYFKEGYKEKPRDLSGFAYSELLGYISFRGPGYGVYILGNQLYGGAYSENAGFLSFSGDNYNVSIVNNSLVGYAYFENLGYVSFSGWNYSVRVINNTLNGTAYCELCGYIVFNKSVSVES